MNFAKMALFKSYAVIYLTIGTAICEILFVFYSCANDDTETATFDHPIIYTVGHYGSPSSAVVVGRS